MNAITQIDDPILTALRSERENLMERIEIAKAAAARLLVVDHAIAVLRGEKPQSLRIRRKRKIQNYSVPASILGVMRSGETQFGKIVDEVLKEHPNCARGNIGARLCQLRDRGYISSPSRGVWVLTEDAA